ncbi:MAG: insulinase family protein, partial [Anaerolineae bacterium]
MPHTDLIIEHLPNGLRVVLRPMYTAPIVTQAIWYRVGARNDPPGRTGISHWVEHMLFHGTPQYPSQWLERQIARCGGFWNASTTLDWTVYYEVVPSANAALLYPLEADRMHNALFRPQDVEQERQVILTERLQNEDSPTYRLMRKVMRTALPNHPYGNPVIGEVQDLQAIDRQALYEHYRRWYTPANATLVWCGDFDPQQVLEALKAAFAEVPAAPIPDLPIPQETPPRNHPILVEEGAGHHVYLYAVYPAPPISHPDFLPFMVTDALLHGATALAFMGGSVSNRT